MPDDAPAPSIPIPAVNGVRHRYVNVNGVRLHLAEAGQGEPLLMLHGWPQHWYEWRHLIDALREDYHVICPDLRGFGWSDAPASGYEKERLVDDIIGIMDVLGLERVRQHPELIGKLMRWDSARGEQWRERDLRWYTAVLQDPARAQASVLLYRTFLLREALPLLRGRYRAARLSVPTLVLTGARDLTVPPALLRGYEPQTEVMSIEAVPDAGHFLSEECPALVAARARAFFAGG
jgi:pimeloyl-ACP methyl ester carboxylesterase